VNGFGAIAEFDIADAEELSTLQPVSRLAHSNGTFTAANRSELGADLLWDDGSEIIWDDDTNIGWEA
jgi:hypothetical protein